MTHESAIKAYESSAVTSNPAWRIFQIFTMLALFVVLAPSAWSATYYVANSGNDANTGTTLTAPFKTIQKAMNKAVAGDTVYVRGGTYREEISVYSGGGSAGNYVNLFAYNNEVPVIKGSDLVTGWVKHSGNIWKKTGWASNSQQVFDSSRDGPSLQQIGMPSRFYTSFHYPSPVGSGVSSMMPGSFYYEAGAQTLYVWLADGADPNTKPIEVSTRRRLLFMGRPYIHVKGLAFRHSNLSAFAEQGSAVELSSYSIIENSDIQYTDFTGLSMGYLQTGALAINCNVSNNGNSGINAAGSYDFRIANSKMNGNNTRNFNTLWHAGGFKGAADTYGTLENNEVGHNKASGIWFDYANGGKPIVIRNNYIHDNGPKEAAIFFEVSNNGLIYNNVIVNNERRGIYLSAADNTRVYNNTIVGTRTYAGIEVGGMPRSGASLTNNAVYNNIISNGTTKYDLTIAPANGSSIAGNTSNNNVFYRASGAIQLAHGSMYSDLTSWRNATKMDQNSISANPAFVLPNKIASAADYTLQSTSPAIDSGMTLAAVEHDYAMNWHKAGNPYDIGAFEFVTTTAAAPAGVDTTAPVIVMSSPSQSGVAYKDGIAKINVSATDNVAVTSMSLYVDGKLVASTSGQPIAYTWDMRALRKGTHTVYVSAVDARKNLTKLSRSVLNYDNGTSTTDTPTTTTTTTTAPSSTTNTSTSTTPTSSTSGSGSTTPTVDTSAPVIALSNPSRDGMSFSNGVANISVSANDNVAVTTLKLYVNGTMVASSTGGPIAYTWDMRSLRKGTHTLYVSAVDARNNLAKVSRTLKNY
jgi:parallel beta-helix repeat protein